MEPNDASNEKQPANNQANNSATNNNGAIGPLDASPAPNGPAQQNAGEANTKPETSNVPNGMNLTVEELYDKDKHDLSTMEPGDVFQLLQ
jgi:hypothetical protein